MDKMTIKIKCSDCGTEYEISQDTFLKDYCSNCEKRMNYEKVNTNLLLKLIDFFNDMLKTATELKKVVDDDE